MIHFKWNILILFFKTEKKGKFSSKTPLQVNCLPQETQLLRIDRKVTFVEMRKKYFIF